MKVWYAIALAGVVSSALALNTSADAACDDNWKDCKGKPWVDGTAMETPLGSKWWPHPMWGAGDEAGSTNWYSKPEVVMRAMAMVKQGKSIIRVTPERWGPVATGGFPARLVAE